MGLTGPSRRVIVEPIQTPQPDREPDPTPAPTPVAPEPDREKVGV